MKRASVAGAGLLLAAALLVLTPSPARAGSYLVGGGCGTFVPITDPFIQARIATFNDCSGVYVRNVMGAFTTAWGSGAAWRFTAPAGTLVGRVSMSGVLTGKQGWAAAVQGFLGTTLEMCPGATCSGGSKSYSMSAEAVNSDDLTVQLWCRVSPNCPNNNGIQGSASASNIVIEIVDTSAPSVGITGGTLLGSWHRLGGSVTVSASDNVGIKLDRVLVDGVTREQRSRACSWGAPVPCPAGPAALSLDTTSVADGPHTLTVQSVDSADNVGGNSVGILVDNTAPAAPSTATLRGGAAWRATNDFAFSWANPAQTYAPIVAARYQICPVSNAASDSTGCVERVATGADVQHIDHITAPGPGAWRMRMWLVDAAGNENAAAATETVLRFDDSPPSVVFEKPAAADPARVRVSARDAVSSLSSVAIEARRRGDAAWAALTTERRADAFTAFVDDEHAKRGTYDLRARAIDAAGNERTGTLRDDGRPAVLTLPVRRPSSLMAGLRRRACSSCFDRAPLLDLGRSVKLGGRLLVAGRPAAQPIEVWRRLQAPGATWARVATVSSSKRGVFSYAVPKGPSRQFRFRFAGTPTVRGATARVDARVRASTTIGVNRHKAVNGEYVTFRGRVRGGHIPTGGKLVELQVFTRRLWRTFAVPRADPKTGRWSYMYRFETISGTARFRFRARVRAEAGYPFHTGSSRQVGVTVQGI